MSLEYMPFRNKRRTIDIFFCISRPTMQNILAPLTVFGIYLDHIKDILIVVQIVSLSGGMYVVGQKWHEFSSVVSINGLGNHIWLLFHILVYI